MTETLQHEPPHAAPGVHPHPHPLRELLSLALPTVAQMASYTAMQFIDTLMLAKAVGTAAPAAVSNAGRAQPGVCVRSSPARHCSPACLP